MASASAAAAAASTAANAERPLSTLRVRSMLRVRSTLLAGSGGGPVAPGAGCATDACAAAVVPAGVSAGVLVSGDACGTAAGAVADATGVMGDPGCTSQFTCCGGGAAAGPAMLPLAVRLAAPDPATFRLARSPLIAASTAATAASTWGRKASSGKDANLQQGP